MAAFLPCTDAEILEALEAGKSQRQIARELSCGRDRIRRITRQSKPRISCHQCRETLSGDHCQNCGYQGKGNPIISSPARIGPKILTFDIETAPTQAGIWRMFKENISFAQIMREWFVLSWAAKWLGDDEVIYEDKSATWDSEDDYELLRGIWGLLDEADIVIAHNGKRFDVKKLNARFIINGMQPPSSYRVVDTLEQAKRHFGFTYNSLAYITHKLCKRHKKLTHQAFPGYKLWSECLDGNQDAWREMEDYNINDVLSLEEVYTIMAPWMKGHPNIDTYTDDTVNRCSCGGVEWVHNGYVNTNLSRFKRFRCVSCGAEKRDRVNLLPKSKRQSMLANIA